MASFQFNPNLTRTPPPEWFGELTDAQWKLIPVADDGSKSDAPWITAAGEIWGTLAGLDSCWLNAVGQCIKPAQDPAAYSPAQNRPKMVAGSDGKVMTMNTGLISFKGGHVPDAIWNKVVATTQPGSIQRYEGLRRWYEGNDLSGLCDDVENAFAAVRYHVDKKRGAITYHGSVMAHRSDADVEMMRSGAVSGDWLRVAWNNLPQDSRTLAGVCAVISPAFRNSITVPRLAASLTGVSMSDTAPERVLISAQHAEAIPERVQAEYVRQPLPMFRPYEVVTVAGQEGEFIVRGDGVPNVDGQMMYELARIVDGKFDRENEVIVSSADMTSTGEEINDVWMESETIAASTDLTECTECNENDRKWAAMMSLMPKEAMSFFKEMSDRAAAAVVQGSVEIIGEDQYSTTVAGIADGPVFDAEILFTDPSGNASLGYVASQASAVDQAGNEIWLVQSVLDPTSPMLAVARSSMTFTGRRRIVEEVPKPVPGPEEAMQSSTELVDAVIETDPSVDPEVVLAAMKRKAKAFKVKHKMKP